jgi:hypothetical protein
LKNLQNNKNFLKKNLKKLFSQSDPVFMPWKSILNSSNFIHICSLD